MCWRIDIDMVIRCGVSRTVSLMNSNAWRVMDEAPDRSDRLHTDSFNFAFSHWLSQSSSWKIL